MNAHNRRPIETFIPPPLFLLAAPDKWCLDNYQPRTCHPPLSDPGGQSAGVRLVHRCQLHDCVLLPDRPNRHMHDLRSTDTEDSRGVQRV